MPDSPVISKRHSTAVLVASGVVAISTFAVTVLSARVLSPADNAEFLVFWSFFNAVLAAITGLQNEATRAVGAFRLGRGTESVRTAPVIAMAAFWGAVVALAWLVSAPLWARSLLPSTSWVVVVVAALACFVYAGQVTVTGAMAGLKRWNHYAGIITTEAMVRLLALIALTLVAAKLESLQLAVTTAALAWLVYLLVFRTAREGFVQRADVALPRLIRNGGLAMLSAVAYAVLVSGFPAMLRLAVGANVPADKLAILIVAIMVTRAPIMMPLVTFQGVAIAAFQRHQGRRWRVLLRIFGLVVAGGAVIAVLVALVGPTVVRLLFGAAYAMSPSLLAGLTLAAVPLAMLTLSGTAALSVGAHRGYAAGWVCAAVVAVLLLFVPVELTGRVMLAMTVGPLVGIVPQIVALNRHEATDAVTSRKGD